MRIDISNRIGTTSNFGGFRGLLDKFSGAAAGYSLRKLSKSATNAVRVRRSSDNTEQDIGFTGTELDTTTLLDFVNARDVAPADYGAGAAAAYSLRYVSDSYTGDVVRVRRDSDNAEADFNPTEITDGTLLSWVGNTASDNGHVTTWYDQSGNSNDATQGTAASQPKIVDAGVLVEENGKPAVDFLTSSSTYLDTSTFSLISQPTTTFAVVRDKSTSNPFRVIHAGTTANKLDFGMTNNDFLYGFSTSLGISNVNIDNQQASVFFLANGASSELAKNGLATETKNIGSALTQVESLRIGEAQGLNADWEGIMQEIIFYPSDQSSNRGNIEANVNDYYSIYTSTNDGFVTTWYDQAGSNNATQATAAAQPQIVDGGSLITENGKVAVEFDGVDDFLSVVTSLDVTLGYTNFYVCSVSSDATKYIFASVKNSNNRYAIGVNDSGNFQSTKRATAIVGDAASYVSGQVLLSDNSTPEIYLDGNLGAASVATLNNSFASELMTIGKNSATAGLQEINGVFQEILLYNSDQSGNRTAIEGNINGHYNIYP